MNSATGRSREFKKPSVDPRAGGVRGASRSGAAAGRRAAQARLAAARSSARLLDRRAAAVEPMGARLCRRGGEAGRIACAVLARHAQSAARDLPERHLRVELRCRRHPCRRDAASRHRRLVGGAGDGRACRRIRARRAGGGGRRLRGDDPGRACRCSPAISSAASRAPAPATCSAPPRPPAGCCSAAPTSRILAAIGLAGSYSSGVAQFYYSGASGKRIQAAHAAQSGVAAALLTQAGLRRPGRHDRRAAAASRAPMPTASTRR